MLTFEPTLALVLKLPTPVDKDDEFINEFTDELPILSVDVADVKFALPTEVSNVLFAIVLEPTFKLVALTIPE